ncbi:hypothetical protein B4Q04_20390 [Zobellia sp. OII3]|uniref:hypothetical protein n=1 Tax=Zobellia sp. OII3 TaxID=2034520 RepID=UPI000B529B9B|nr:hypothetical protein [Zobellia sp. OII3]OWW23444.1 hypothetical protein B4Q04_20390 [Zobellia sp. OII3]
MKCFRINHFIAYLLFFVASTVFSQQIERSIFITANTADDNDSGVLEHIVSEVNGQATSSLLIIGNAVSNSDFKQTVAPQLKVLNGAKEVLFIPGYKEWAKGHKGVRNIEDYIQDNSNAKFSPDDAEPIKHHDLGENVELITVDSQWFLEDWDKHVYINEDSEIQNRTLFFLEFENRIKKAQGKTILVAMYHPIETNSKQGLFRNIGGFSSQDFQNKQYRTLRNRLKTIARGGENVIFLSGQGRNLQYIKGSVPQINSGAAGSLEAVKKGEEGDFSLRKNGYVRLDITTDGEVIAHYEILENGAAKEVFKTIVLRGEVRTIRNHTFLRKTILVRNWLPFTLKKQLQKVDFTKHFGESITAIFMVRR